MEHVISEECLDSIRRECVEAGRLGREAFTVRGPDGPRVTRCRDCLYSDSINDRFLWCGRFENGVEPWGFCAWGRGEVAAILEAEGHEVRFAYPGAGAVSTPGSRY